MVVGKGRLLTDGLNRAASKKQIPISNSLTHERLFRANGTPNRALQRTAPVCHAGCLRSRRASPPPSLSLGSLDDERSHRAVLLPLRVLAAKAKIDLELEVDTKDHS